MHASTLLGFLLFSAAWAFRTTQIGLTRGENSWPVDVPLDDCHDLDEEDITTVFTSKKCLVFTGPVCTGRRVQLLPGEHSSDDPVPLGSIYCPS